jgi:hypothetical protein
MNRLNFGPKSILFAGLALLLFLSGASWQRVLAQPAPSEPDRPAAQPAALATTLSSYFISGNTFTPGLGSDSYARQANGCVNQIPLHSELSAPVHLPQASQVVSVTLFTYEAVLTITFSGVFFVINDGQGGNFNLLPADSDSGIIGYQHHDNLGGDPVTIDNELYSYQVDWRKVAQEGEADSPLLSLCGVRLSYYAPVGATFLPVVER